MGSTAVRTPEEFERDLRRYVVERSEETRAVLVGEKETSEQAAIVARHADLFTRAQLHALLALERAGGEDGERIYRLCKTCESGIVVSELAERGDALENALLGARVTWDGEELPLRSAYARLAVEPGYLERQELGALVVGVSASLDAERTELLAAAEELFAELSGEPDPVARSSAEKGISLDELRAAAEAASAESGPAWDELRERWFDRLLGPDRDREPSSAHIATLRRLSPLADTYSRERAVEVCLSTVERLGFDLRATTIRLDVEDRPQKSPRACVIAADPPHVVHLITRAQGGLHDYAAFLHETGHALHYAGVDPELPYTYRKIARDHALTEVFSFILEAIVREPGWHAEHFGLGDDDALRNAEAGVFLEALLFRRYAAKLGFELEFWARFAERGATPDGYAERLTAATGMRYPASQALSDMDPGFYSADYLRAWIRCAQLRDVLVREVGEDWWRRPETGERLRELFREGTRPTSEELAVRLGHAPLDTGPLVRELSLL